MTVRTFYDLGKTERGRNEQIARARRGMAEEMKNKQVVPSADCDEPQTVEQWRALVASLEMKLADAESLIAEMRAESNSDAPVATVSTAKYWDTKRMAKESGVAVCTICRNADVLGGIKMGGDWLFPAGTKYGKKRKRQ